ncbi:MAG: Hsp20/alpha crystallin family protein [Clostridia bacterium]|nr:Hsp20/alpha crystallin family protein [Clostridia bacterium]
MFELRPYNHRNAAAKYDPFRELNDLEREFFGLAPFRYFKESGLGEFRTDLKDCGDSYMLEADLPGFEKKDIAIEMNGDVLKITAERHSEHEEEDKKKNYIRCERSYGSYTREFDISGVEADAITAKYDNGVLTLNMPKKKETLPESRRLEIE